MTTVNQPQPHGLPYPQPYVVIIGSGKTVIEVPCDTIDEAWQIRDDAIDQGYLCRILGLPCSGYAVVPHEDQSLDITDD